MCVCVCDSRRDSGRLHQRARACAGRCRANSAHIEIDLLTTYWPESTSSS